MNDVAPDPSRPSPSALEDLDRARRHMLSSLVIASVLMLLPQILLSISEESVPHTVTVGLAIAAMIGGFVWMGFMWRFHRFQQRVKNQPELRRSLNDERIVSIRREAVFRTWFVLVVIIGLGVAVAPFVTLPDQAVLLTLLLVAVDTPLLFFLALDRD